MTLPRQAPESQLFIVSDTEVAAGPLWPQMVEARRHNAGNCMSFRELGMLAYGAASPGRLDIDLDSFSQAVEPPLSSAEKSEFGKGVWRVQLAELAAASESVGGSV